MPYRIRLKRDVDDELRRVLVEQIDRALAAAAGYDLHEAVHEVRRRCKKARAALRLARPALGKAYKRENAALRDTARLIAHLRDAQAVVEAVEKLSETHPDAHPALNTALEALRSRRTAAATAEELREALEEAAGQLGAVRPRFADLSIQGEEFDILAGGLQRTYRDARRAMRAAREEPTIARLHEWRKRIKDHRYQIRMLRDIWPEAMQMHMAELRRLSDFLGADHDLATLTDIMRQNPVDLEAEALRPIIDRRRKELIAEAWPLGARLLVERPGAFTDRIERLWSVACA